MVSFVYVRNLLPCRQKAEQIVKVDVHLANEVILVENIKREVIQVYE